MLKTRVRLTDMLSDNDPLRSGFITRAKFESSLKTVGVLLNPSELLTLEQHFSHPKDKNLVAWRDFDIEVTRAFVDADVSQHPALCVIDVVISLVMILAVVGSPTLCCRQPHVCWPRASRPLSSAAWMAMRHSRLKLPCRVPHSRLRSKTPICTSSSRQVTVTFQQHSNGSLCIQDFDPLRSGHVTEEQFIRAISTAKLLVSDREAR